MINDIIDGVVGGLTDFFGSIGAGFVDLIINLISFLINLILLPINALISVIFPDLSNIINNFYNTFTYVFTDLIGYIFSYIPPMSKLVIITFITIYISYYSVKYVYKGIIIVPKIYNKIKFW